MDGRGRLDVVIVNYRSAELTIRCVDSLLRHRIAGADSVVVVDNKSPDGSLQKLSAEMRGVKIIAAERNGGFGAGVNLGVGMCSGENILVLNPDTYFERNSVADVLALMATQPNIAIVGLDLVDPDGTRQYSGRRFYSFLDIVARRAVNDHWIAKRRIERHLMKGAWSQEVPFEAEWVMGTGFVIRRRVFEEINGMDEDYFLYMEDVDLCARVWKARYSVVCLPGAQLVHDHQRASASSPFSRAARQHVFSLIRFARKFYFPFFTPPGVDRTIR
jgi:N-acetylglucosaminyl-diphospho-decaprenol L-rhamnosyltransferase